VGFVATVIVSDDTIRNLLEAHASLAAWYYQTTEALRAAELEVEQPSEAQRKAYLAQAGSHFPELAAIASSIQSPRNYVPAPAIAAPAEVTENEGVEIAAPPADYMSTPERVPGSEPVAPQKPPPAAEQQPQSAPASAVPPPPPMVDPTKVKENE